MMYWCTYYATHIGIALKALDVGSRNALSELLGVLERVKEDIGANDALDIEADSAAYVENFALKMFNAAEKQVRKGDVNRLTAKKFSAAADFLEILKVFPNVNLSKPNEEKICYAKQKAVDIIKSLHKCHKSTPRSAGPSQEVLLSSPSTKSTSPPLKSTPPHSPSPTASSSTQKRDIARIARASAPPRIHPSDIERANANFTYRHLHSGSSFDGQDSPGNWSTVATPGTVDWIPDTDVEGNRVPREGVDQHCLTSGRHLEGQSLHPPPRCSADTLRRDRVEGLATSKSRKNARQSRGEKSSGTKGSPTWVEHPSPPVQHTKSLWPQTTPSPTLQPTASQVPANLPGLLKADVNTQPKLEPVVIAKAQKHARFAISALDYEDAERSRKELRAALAILGGR